MTPPANRTNSRPVGLVAAHFVAVGCAFLSLVGCSNAPRVPALQQAVSAQSPAHDSSYFTSAQELLKASDALVLVDVGNSRQAVIDGITYAIYEAEVVAAHPHVDVTRLEVAAIPSNGTAETIDLAKNTRYALFVTLPDAGPAQLTSPSQGVFVVHGSKAGASPMGTFPLGELAATIGLQ